MIMKFKIIFFTILQLYAVTLANCADAKDDEEIEEVLNFYNQVDTKITSITGLILSSVDFIACLYIIVRTFLRWKQYRKFPIPISLLFPFYIALIEIGIAILQILTWSYPVVGKIWEKPLCNMIGISSMFLLNFMMSLVIFIIFITWYKVMRKSKFSFGRYDYIIFVITIGIAIFYTLIGVGEYGNGHAWCSIQSTITIVLYLSLVMTMINLLTLLILYINTLRYIKKSDLDGRTYLPEKDISKKTLSYTPAYIFQSILLMTYTVSTMAGFQHMAMDLIYIIGMTICGPLITIQYIMNEGWIHRPISFSLNLLKNPSLNNSSLRNVSASFQLSGRRFPFIKIKIDVVQQQTTQQMEI